MIEQKKNMPIEEALKDISDARKLLSRGYKKLMNVEVLCEKNTGYPLKDILIGLGAVNLALVIVEDDYSKLKTKDK